MKKYQYIHPGQYKNLLILLQSLKIYAKFKKRKSKIHFFYFLFTENGYNIFQWLILKFSFYRLRPNDHCRTDRSRHIRNLVKLAEKQFLYFFSLKITSNGVISKREQIRIKNLKFIGISIEFCMKDAQTNSFEKYKQLLVT